MTRDGYVMVGVLFVINLLNYMDRYTVAGMYIYGFLNFLFVGVLSDVKSHFCIRDQFAGLLSTIFSVFYLIFAPIFGYFGDRFPRKPIMVYGITIWIAAVVGSSLIPAHKAHWTGDCHDDSYNYVSF